MKQDNIRFTFMLIVALFLSVYSFGQKKDSVVQKPKVFILQEGQTVITWNLLELLKKLLPTAEAISAKEASAAFPAIDSIQKVLYRQSVDTTTKKK
jgi:hypothetical protein